MTPSYSTISSSPTIDDGDDVVLSGLLLASMKSLINELDGRRRRRQQELRVAAQQREQQLQPQQQQEQELRSSLHPHSFSSRYPSQQQIPSSLRMRMISQDVVAAADAAATSPAGVGGNDEHYDFDSDIEIDIDIDSDHEGHNDFFIDIIDEALDVIRSDDDTCTTACSTVCDEDDDDDDVEDEVVGTDVDADKKEVVDITPRVVCVDGRVGRDYEDDDDDDDEDEVEVEVDYHLRPQTFVIPMNDDSSSNTNKSTAKKYSCNLEGDSVTAPRTATSSSNIKNTCQ